MENKEKKSVIEIVNEKIIKMLENGISPWRKEWRTSGGVAMNEARNYITNKAYSGINTLLLGSGYYLTFKQIQELGGHVKKGCSAYMVVYSNNYLKEVENENGDKEVKNGYVLKYYNVFALEDTEGCREIKNRIKETEEVADNPLVAKNEEVEEVIKEYCKRCHLIVKNFNQDKAYYSPSSDSVTLPMINQFTNQESYYSTAFHELGHSTGHASRLNREGVAFGNSYFGSSKYSKEELVAEITAAYCCNYLNIDTKDTLSNSVAYLKSWADHLKNNTASYFILKATTNATKAFNLIMNL